MRARPSMDLSGQRFGRLVAVAVVGRTLKREYKWSCVCDCGGRTVARGSHLRRGEAKSCGCWRSGRMADRNFRHGKAGTSVYARYRHMRDRCENPSHPAFKNYGGRGITVCRRWHKFENFYADMGDPPSGLTLERVNNNQGYSKANCVWATRSVQRRNQRRRV